MNETNLTYQCPQCGQRFSVEEDADGYLITCPGCGGELDLTELNPVEIPTADSPREASSCGIVVSDSIMGQESVPSTDDSSAHDASANHDVVFEVAERVKNVSGKAIDAAARIARKENRDKAKAAVSDAMKSGKAFIQRLSDKTKSTNTSGSYRWPEPGRSSPQFWLWRIPIIGYILRELLNWVWTILHPSFMNGYANVDLERPRHYVTQKAYGWFGLNWLYWRLGLKRLKMVRFDYSDRCVRIENADGSVLEAPISDLTVKFQFNAQQWHRLAIITLDEDEEFYVVELHASLPRAAWDDIFGILHHAGQGKGVHDKHSDKLSFAKQFAEKAVESIVDSI